MTRLLLMAPPRGGLTMFDAEIPEDAVLMRRVSQCMERKMLDEVLSADECRNLSTRLRGIPGKSCDTLPLRQGPTCCRYDVHTCG